MEKYRVTAIFQHSEPSAHFGADSLEGALKQVEHYVIEKDAEEVWIDLLTPVRVFTYRRPKPSLP